MVRITFQRVAHREPQPLPAYRTAGSSGMDLHAAGGVSIEPGARALVPTGFAVAVPAGYEAQIRPRSGLAARSGVTVLNAPGTIDSDYRGEVLVLLVNLGQDRVDIRPGERIAQMVIAPLARAETEIADELPATGRGAGGFGSTGT